MRKPDTKPKPLEKLPMLSKKVWPQARWQAMPLCALLNYRKKPNLQG